MPVVVDNENLSADQLGLRTIGQVLAHVQRENRLIVHILVDGQEPDMEGLSALRQSAVEGHTLFVETTEPQTIAGEVLGQAEEQLRDAGVLSKEAVAFFRADQPVKAFERLSGCFSRWHHTQQSVQKIAELLRIDLGRVDAGGSTMNEFLSHFSTQLREIKQSLERRDYVGLCDVLDYEMPQCTQNWHAAIASIRSVTEA